MDGNANKVTINDVDYVEVVLGLCDGSGFRVPLTALQGALLLRQFGFGFDQATGEPVHFTDAQLVKIFKLDSKEDT